MSTVDFLFYFLFKLIIQSTIIFLSYNELREHFIQYNHCCYEDRMKKFQEKTRKNLRKNF